MSTTASKDMNDPSEISSRAEMSSPGAMSGGVPLEGDDLGRFWSVGELAAAAGVSVRTLHHYDQIGLLTPAERSGSGHRRYSADEVRRLYRILALRSLGFDLGVIAGLLEGGDSSSLLDTARQQLRDVGEQQRQITRLKIKLAGIVRTLEAHEQPSTGDLLHAMEATSMSIKLTRIYTRGGDKGETSLGSRRRVAKTHPIIEAGGAVDELNSQLGAALAMGHIEEPHAGWLHQIQNELFDVGADITVPPAEEDQKPRLRLTHDYIDRLEEWCDQTNETLAPLDSFILPGGSPVSAQLHVARAVCRRAERRVLDIEAINPEVVRYLNRLSDLLFLLTRATSDQPRWRPAMTPTA
jgi:cob(I)alamin adenosyltransferase